MSSGYGIRGGIGRCYPFYADFKECLKNDDSTKGPVCAPLREDYFECLHHKKEYDHVRTVTAQQKKNEALALAGGEEAAGGGH